MSTRRILHTSDWHLGQRFHSFDRTWEHQQFLAWLLKTIAEREVDAVLISGDLFDTVHPSTVAQRQWFDFLHGVLSVRPQCDVVAIGGNHDSGMLLDASESLTRRIGVTVIGGASTPDREFDPARLVVPLGSRAPDGPWGWAAAIPFLRAEDLGTLAELQHDDAYVTLNRKRHDAVFAHLESKADPKHARVALGHGVISGSKPSPSERTVFIGTSPAVPVDVFPTELAYVALGHLHRPQRAGGREHVRYAGSPLPLHVSEADYEHQVVLVTLEDGVRTNIEPLHLPKWVRVHRVPHGGKPADPEAVLDELRALPSHADKPEAERPYLAVTFRLTKPEPDFSDRVNLVIRDKGYRLTTVEAAQDLPPTEQSHEGASVRLDELTPREVFLRLYRFRYPEREPDPELVAAFDALLQRTQDEQKEVRS